MCLWCKLIQSGIGVHPIVDEKLKEIIDHPVLEPAYYTGEGVTDWFCKKLKSIAQNMDIIYNNHHIEKDKSLKDEDCKRDYKSKWTCWVCNHTIEDIKDKVRNHQTRNYAGPIHITCNLKVIYKKVIMVYFHNMTSYDLHFLIGVKLRKAR